MAGLGTKKATNGLKFDTWENVPLQNFLADSDIDWSKSILEVDQQLYRKYELTTEEIAFIEENIRSMD